MPPARAPFVLTPQEEQQLNQILMAWEQTSNAVKTYKSQFTRWEYDTVFGPKTDARTRCQGELKFMAPDKGSFRINSVYNPTTKKYESGPPDQLEHWVCDGKSVFEINHKEKTRTERPLPPELQGTAISDGPLPFVFGAKRAKLKERYWMRQSPAVNDPENIWLEAYPRYQADAANFKYVEIIISRKEFMPVAIQLFSPGFDPKRGNEIVAPTVPFNYKKIVLQPRVDQGPLGDAQNSLPDQRSARVPRNSLTR
jgi:TIGR03009 family protein